MGRPTNGTNKQKPNTTTNEQSGKYPFNMSVFYFLLSFNQDFYNSLVIVSIYHVSLSLLHKASSKKAVKENNEAANKNKDLTVKSPTAFTPNEEQSKKLATSLILFEEVDVIFDDDSGFLAAIKTFMTTTKRPVILTTSGEH